MTPGEKDLPLLERHCTKANVWIAIYSFLGASASCSACKRPKTYFWPGNKETIGAHITSTVC